MPINNCKIGKNVVFEEGNTSIIEDCKIGDSVFIGAYSKLVNVNIGNNTKIFSFVNLYGPSLNIGNNCKIGSFVEIQKDVDIGDFCVVSSHSFICSGVFLRGHNFIGHLCGFTNDKQPQAFNKNYKMENTIIQEYASIGSRTILLPVIVGRNALIGCGAVITKNVPDNAIVIGNPGRILKYKET